VGGPRRHILLGGGVDLRYVAGIPGVTTRPNRCFALRIEPFPDEFVRATGTHSESQSNRDRVPRFFLCFAAIRRDFWCQTPYEPEAGSKSGEGEVSGICATFRNPRELLEKDFTIAADLV
jgi:hypothetical protein